ncbi:hypothetical protein PZA11_003314 [Diplocarpon coronariae]
MPALTRTVALTIRPRHLSPAVVVLTASRHPLSTSTSLSRDSQYYRPDFQSQEAGCTGSYEPGRPTEGPLSKASKHGAPRLTPLLLKEHLDNYVVGQDKAKKVTSVAIFNHYQRIRELRRLAEEKHAKAEEHSRWEQRERERELTSHPVESRYHLTLLPISYHIISHRTCTGDANTSITDEYPGHARNLSSSPIDAPYRWIPQTPSLSHPPALSHLALPQSTTINIEKSNLLLLGPSGVGKTYILSTLARILEVPFATVDCSALTQAGYIGTDIESAIERLLLASSHSISACESGIIFFDEVDKLAKPAVMTHGRDVSGEGVQQGLLKMIEGTTVTVNAKSDRSSKSENAGRGAGRDAMQQQGKSEQYTIDTTNILFVFAGAFVGLEKIISSRLSTGSSLGFGAQLRSSLPSNLRSNPRSAQPRQRNLLDAVTPSDLQHYGLIPELLGRIPILASLTPLSLSQLTTILTSPRNSLVKQFVALFNTYGIQLRFTTGALHAIAEWAASSSSSSSSSSLNTGGVGARGLRSILESLLNETMFRGPGSAIRFVLVDEAFVRSQSPSPSTAQSPTAPQSRFRPHPSDTSSSEEEDDEPPLPRCFSRSQSLAFEEAYEQEEEAWKSRADARTGSGAVAGTASSHGVDEGEGERGFENFRRVGGSGM